jgi:arylformamidase
MRIYDITVPLSAKTPTYPGDPKTEISDWSSLAKGDAANVSLLHFGSHSGTHVDAPAHFIPGAGRVESLPLDVLIGPAQVVELPVDRASVDEEFVTATVRPESRRVLFKTRNSAFWSSQGNRFQEQYTYVDLAAARKLIAMGVRLVGIDYLSVEKFQQHDHETHHALLSQGVIILEGLNLTDITPGIYELICLPLKIAEGAGDGAPARVVLREL